MLTIEACMLLVQLDGDFKGSLECGPGALRDLELEIEPGTSLY